MIDLSKFHHRSKEVELGGKKFTFVELTWADLAQFSSGLKEGREKTIDKRRERLLEQAKKIGDIEPLELLERLERPPSEEEIDAEMMTIEGMGFSVYLSLKHNYPEVTLEQAMSMVSIGETEQISEIMFGEETKEKAKAKNSRRPAKKK